MPKTFPCRAHCQNIRVHPFILCPECWGKLPDELKSGWSRTKKMEDDNNRREIRRRIIADAYQHLHALSRSVRAKCHSRETLKLEEQIIRAVRHSRDQEDAGMEEREGELDHGQGTSDQANVGQGTGDDSG